MKVSLICPTYNEKDSIKDLIESMLNQSKIPDEIIFVDSYSTDGTAEIIKEYSDKNVRLIQKKSNIAEARNIAILNSKYDIIACTDASSKLDIEWLGKITEPFHDDSISVVSGGYIHLSKSKGIENYISMITVQSIEDWKEDTFLPSGRSIAFRKYAWKSVGGYPENLYTGEDTLFDLNLKKKGFKFKLAKDALVYWTGRNTLKKFIKQFYLYGFGDGESNNIFKMKTNFLFFSLFNLYILFFILALVFFKEIFIYLFIPFFLYLMTGGIKFSKKYKNIRALFVIPFLMFFKRISYFVGIWGGLIR
jgi:glycosyltransferase involved in cell wall biosynthesis